MVAVFNSPMTTDGRAGGLSGECGVRDVVGHLACAFPQTGFGVALEAVACDADDRSDEGVPFAVDEMAARIEHLDHAQLMA